MMQQFLDKLAVAFPEESKILVVKTCFEEAVTMNVRKPMELFVAALQPYSEYVINKDARLFDKPIELPGGLDMAKLWALPDVHPDTRDAIFNYIQTLFTMGTMVIAIPPNLMENLESVAQGFASQIQQGGGNLDTGSMASLLGEMMGSGAMGNMLSMLGPGIQESPLCLPRTQRPPRTSRSALPHSKRFI